jgi:hypothetical protein
MRDFGDVFEGYCRWIGEMAQADPRFRGRLILSDTIGSHDEIEDLVITDDDACALFAVKSGVMPLNKLKGGKCRSDVVDWL